MKARILLGLGSNIGDGPGQIAAALERLQDSGLHLVSRAADYATEPVGYTDQPWFTNTCALMETPLSARGVLRALQAVEDAFHRERPFPNAPRTLDLDLLYYGDAVIRDADLQVPHPRLHERGFVLYPLDEIASDWIDPRWRVTVRELLGRYQARQDTAKVQRKGGG